jgi:hypothetical protein
MNRHAFKGPGEKDMEKLGIPNSMHSDSNPKSTDSALVKTKGGGGGATGKKAKEDRDASNANALAANENRPTPEMERANTPRSENSAVKPKAALKKVGWTAAKTYFKSDAEVYAEFDIPAEIKDKTLVEFELFRKENAEIKSAKKVQVHTDASGRATVVLPVPASEEPKATFVIKVKHCSGEWSSGQGTEREVSETAEISIEHTQVSGIHFPKGKSFIADIYLDALSEVKKTYSDWKKTHDKAQIVVYGHCESDEGENPLTLSRNRGLSVFSFLIGDVDRWTDIAEKERWGVWEQQCMLRALGFFKVKPTGNLGPKTRQAVQDFIGFLNEARCMNINPMLGLSEAYIRRELYREYMNVRRTEIEIPSSVFRTVAGFPYVGCSSFNRYRFDESIHDENRRAVILILKESANFPVTFPCRSGTTGPCESECKKAGDRSIKGFGCKFYDQMVRSEKIGQKVPEKKPSANEEKESDSAGVKYDIDKAVAYLEANLFPTSQGACAKHVRLAILAGGVSIYPNPVPAKEYGPYLTKHGFVEISQENYAPKKGDISVIQPYIGGKPYGHMTMYGGKIWLSDFAQNDMWSGRGYREHKPPYRLYRWEKND